MKKMQRLVRETVFKDKAIGAIDQEQLVMTSEGCFALICDLVELLFTHPNDSEHFYKKFIEAVHPRELLRKGITTPISNRLYLDSDMFSESELHILQLIYAGFTTRQICALCHFASPASFHVKMCRIKKKIMEIEGVNIPDLVMEEVF